MTYNGERLAGAECEREKQEDWRDTRAWTFTYDGDALAEVVYYHGGYDQNLTETWTFGVDEVTSSSVYTFLDDETTTMRRFAPDLIIPRHPFELLDGPTGEHALLYHHARMIRTPWGTELSVEEFTFTFDGPLPAPGTRTRTRNDGDTVMFTHDEQGRLTDGFVYDGDLVVKSPTAEYVHDEHGNLLERVTDLNTTTYDYSCW